MKVVALYRVSTERQADSGLGLEAQKHAVETYALAHGLQVVAEYTEAGVSGKTPLEDRTGLLEAVAQVAVLEADALIVAKLDRLTRDTLIQLTVERALARKGARVISCAGEGTQGDDPSQVLLRRIMGAVAEAEASVLSGRVKAALAAKKARGERLGRPPFGLVVNNEGSLAPCRFDFQYLVRCLQLREQRLTYHKIANVLHEEDQEGSWSHQKVFRIVKRWGSLDGLYSQPFLKGERQ